MYKGKAHRNDICGLFVYQEEKGWRMKEKMNYGTRTLNYGAEKVNHGVEKINHGVEKINHGVDYSVEKIKGILGMNNNLIDNAFEENEARANNFTAKALMIMLAIVGLSWILTYAGVFAVDKKRMTLLLVLLIPEIVIPCIINRIYEGRRNWLKYLLLAACVTLAVSLDAVLTYNVTLIMIMPVLISCHYYSNKLTRGITLLTSVCFLGSTIYGVYYGMIDLNIIKLPLGTTLMLNDSLDKVVSGATILYRESVISALKYIYLPKLLAMLALSPICHTIATRTKRLITEQDDIARRDERINTELSVATTIQNATLPKILATFPNRKEFDIYATMHAAKEVGGDFYDCFFVDEDHFVFVIADVSGKGIPAAMFMVVSKILIKNHMQEGMSPEEAFNKTNKQLCEGNDANMFVTAWAGLLEISTGHLTYVNAGHNAPLLKRADGSYEYLKSKAALVLGAMDIIKYKQQELDLCPGDAMYLYTDGVTEAINAKQEQYGEERLKDVLNDCLEHEQFTRQELLEYIFRDICTFAGEEEQFDDITMLAIKINETGKKEGLHEEDNGTGNDR